MKFRTTFFLLVAVILLGGFIWFVDQRSESTREREEQARKAMNLVADRISYFRVESTNVLVEGVAEDGTWRLVQPVRDRADSAAIDRLLSGLQNLPRGEVITASDRESRNLQLADYGLDLPWAKITLGDSLRRRTILIGRTALLGGSVYIKDESLSDIIATDTNLLQIIPQAASDLRDRAIFHGAPEQVQRLAVHSGGGFFQMAKDAQGQWVLQQPLVARASPMVVQTMLEDLFDLHVEQFVAESRSDLVAYNLDDAGIKVSISSDGREGETELWLGGLVKTNQDLVYVRVKGSDSIYAVRAKILGRLATKVEDLRDRRLMTLSVHDISYFRAEAGEHMVELRKERDTWKMVEPKPWKVDPQRMRDLLTAWVGASIVAFVDNIETNLSAMGLMPPAQTLKFARRPPPKPGEEAQSISVGDEVTVRISSAKRELGRVLVDVEQERASYEILSDTLKTVSMDPLFYRDREVLNLNPDDVLKIKLSQNERESVAVRGPTGEFQAVGSSDERIDPEVVRDLLMAACHLVVFEFVADTPATLSDYGLDKPRAVLALSLKGEAGVGKAILLGADVDMRGVYAMLRGQDEVFVLENRVKKKLLQDPIMAPSQSPETPADAPTKKPIAQ